MTNFALAGARTRMAGQSAISPPISATLQVIYAQLHSFACHISPVVANLVKLRRLHCFAFDLIGGSFTAARSSEPKSSLLELLTLGEPCWIYGRRLDLETKYIFVCVAGDFTGSISLLQTASLGSSVLHTQ